MNNKEKYYLAKQAGIWSELFGPVTSSLAGGSVGAAGAALGGGNPVEGFARGGRLSLAGGNLLGSIAALITRTRNREEQVEAEDDVWKNLLIPGVAQHSLWKRLGHGARGEGGTGEEAEELDRKERRKRFE